MLYIFFFKQKAAYELRMSDWSSDVCSSELILVVVATIQVRTLKADVGKGFMRKAFYHELIGPKPDRKRVGRRQSGPQGFITGCQIGRASCRERVCQYV